MMNSQTKHLRRRSLALILVIAALVIGGISITRSAAQAAIPGDALYPVKTTIEQTRLTLAQDAGDRAQMKMGFAEQRLEEIAALIEEGRYREVNNAVLAFEADINSAILELETVSQVDPARAARIALEITAALTRYAQTLGVMAANAPDSVRPEVARALDTAQIVGSLELPTAGLASDDNSNANTNDNANVNANGNDDDSNANDNADDDNANDNANGDDRISNNNDDDDGTNANGNANGDDRISNNNGNANSNGDDSNANVNANGNGDDSNANSNGDDGNGNANSNGDDSNANANGNTNSNANGNGDDSGTNGNGNANANGNDNGNGNANNNGDD